MLADLVLLCQGLTHGAVVHRSLTNCARFSTRAAHTCVVALASAPQLCSGARISVAITHSFLSSLVAIKGALTLHHDDIALQKQQGEVQMDCKDPVLLWSRQWAEGAFIARLCVCVVCVTSLTSPDAQVSVEWRVKGKGINKDKSGESKVRFIR